MHNKAAQATVSIPRIIWLTFLIILGYFGFSNIAIRPYNSVKSWPYTSKIVHDVTFIHLISILNIYASGIVWILIFNTIHNSKLMVAIKLILNVFVKNAIGFYSNSQTFLAFNLKQFCL